MTNTTNPTGKLTFRLAKRFCSGSGASGTYTVVIDGAATSILVRRTGFDYTLRTDVWEVLHRDLRGQHFSSKVEAAQAAVAAGLR